jgi:hypothetical protein
MHILDGVDVSPLQATGHIITPCRFAVLRDDEVHGWLGASPDGLIDSFSAQPGASGPLCTALPMLERHQIC